MAPKSGPPANPIVVIPARLASQRLPSKPLADIHGEPMIVHVWRRAIAADFARVVVACADAEIVEVVEKVGGEAVLTDPKIPSGTDRVHATLASIDPKGKHDVVVNLQGDLPTISAATLKAVLTPLADAKVDIATLAAPIANREERDDPHVVKAVIELAADARIGRALYFSRCAVPSGDGPLYHHIGVYAFRRAALDRFVGLSPGVLEMRERLEQLRALAAGMRIDAAVVDELPLGVDTPADLKRVRDSIEPPPDPDVTNPADQD
ncbi:MAG: 3-deoxy-manno-octulosonate cytidylyltransferase [Rhodospirillaceae bacterium]|nr:3-deoxy-manno-octulosonate cytidylyltransferase [Rhodospirillaceae bacterium]